MIAITAKEKKVISEKYPQVHVVRTMRQDSKRRHYYCEEAGCVMRLLRAMRGQDACKAL